MTLAKAFFADPRLNQAKNQLLETIHDHQQKITKIKPANAALVLRYEDLIKAFSLIRGANLWYPHFGSGLGNGSLVELADGSVKYDMITGIG